MDIKFKIIKVVPEEHQVMVRYYSDLMPEEKLASAYDENGNISRYRTDYMVTLPIPAPTGAEFDEFIMRYCPVSWFALQEKIADPTIDTSLSSLKTLVGKERVVTIPQVSTPAQVPATKK